MTQAWRIEVNYHTLPARRAIRRCVSSARAHGAGKPELTRARPFVVVAWPRATREQADELSRALARLDSRAFVRVYPAHQSGRQTPWRRP
jgi:hypothetical protein